MRYLILPFLILFYPVGALSVPSVGGLNGVVNHNETVVISGSDFGVKSPAAPYAYDDFESCSNGSNVVGRSTPIGSKTWAEYSSYGSPVCRNSDSYGVGTMTAGKTSDGNDWRNSGIKGLNGMKGYCTYTFKYNTATSNYEDAIYKPGRLLATGDMYNPDPKIYPQYQIDTWPYDGLQPGGVTNPPKWPMPHLTQNKWWRYEMYLELSNPAGALNGNAWSSFDRNAGIDIVNGNTRGTSVPNAKVDSCALPLWIGNNNSNTYNFWVAKFYMDNTQARVEICNASTWGAATHCEIQIPSAWSTTSATVTIKQGSFSNGEDGWLFIIDADGTPSSGLPLTFGEGGGDVTPIEIVPPTTPMNGATGLVRNVSVSIPTSEDPNLFTVNDTTVLISPGTAQNIAYSGGNITFDTTGQLYDTTYTVTVTTGLEDTSGNALETNYVFSYTTMEEPIIINDAYKCGGVSF